MNVQKNADMPISPSAACIPINGLAITPHIMRINRYL